MAFCWISVHVTVLLIMCSFTTVTGASTCAEIHGPSAVVLLGSSVKASCNIKDDCPLTKDQDFHVEWPYKNHLSYINMANQDKRVHEILISNFTDATKMLECAICIHEGCSVVAGLEIKAANPPPAPQNLTCQLNLTYPITWLCTWNLVQETSSIPTNYSLQTEFSGSPQKNYVPAPGTHFYRVPRDGFPLFNEVKVQVVATNVLGQTTSECLVLDPMETAILDTPQIQSFGTERHGCLEHRWRLSESQKWINKIFSMEIRLKPVNAKDSEQVVPRRGKPGSTMVCGLLHGMIYQSDMRVRYRNSPWSEWSNYTMATTLTKAPTGQLVTWLKLLGQPTNRHLQAELFWKPSLQFRANSMNVSYIVSTVISHSKRAICVTNLQYCSLKIPVAVRKIYLTAKNSKGKSSPTEVAVYKHIEQINVPYLKVLPKSDDSILTEWSNPPSSAVTAYVLEWKTMHKEVSFEIVDRNQTSMIVSGLEPFKAYEISVYPKYKDGIGQPYTVLAYTKQKAPSQSPNLKFDIKDSYIKFSWDEIPLEQKNGIITAYKIFYWVEENWNDTGVVDIKGTEKDVVLRDLHPSSTYKILFMVSTMGGSLNGTIVTVKTLPFDVFEIYLIVIPACVGLGLVIFGVFTYFSNSKFLKKFLWPMIPDPANSSIKKWTTADSLQILPPFKEVKDPVPVYLSHFSLLSLSEKELWKENMEYLHCDNWTYDEKSVNEDNSDSSRDSGIYNSGSQSESVPYATVVFANQYRTQQAPPPAYLRSESTQPLLGEEEPSSPHPYEKMLTEVRLNEGDHFSTLQKDLKSEEINGSLWENFPMLKSVEINTIHNQG